MAEIGSRRSCPFIPTDPKLNLYPIDAIDQKITAINTIVIPKGVDIERSIENEFLLNQLYRGIINL